MKPWEEIVKNEGQEILDAILVVYINFYYAELEIIDLCAKWIPRRCELKEKFMLVEHASDEVKHSRLFKKGVEDLGLSWDELDHNKYRLPDVSGRFSALARSEDELDVLIGLNLYAEGVLAMEELVQLHQRKPRYFNSFGEIIPDEARHLKYGIVVVKRLLSENSNAQERAQILCNEYRDHIQQYLWGDVSPKIDQGIRYGYLSDHYRQRAAERFENVMSSVGLKVDWSESKMGSKASPKFLQHEEESNVF